DLQAQAQQFDPIALTQDITILEELRRNIRQSRAGRALLDATLVRMALADQFASIGDLLARLDGNGAAPSRPAASRPATTSSAPAAQKKTSEPPPAVARASAASTSAADAAADTSPSISSPSIGEDDDDDLPRPGKVWSGPSLAEASKSSIASAAAAPRAAT